MFRKTGGFSFLISVILSMEDSLSSNPRHPWEKVASKADIFDLLKTILHTIVISMRYEPANAKFFEVEVKWMTLCSALKRVGCFDSSRNEVEPRATNDYVKRNFDLFENIFTSSDDSFSTKIIADCTQVSPNHETGYASTPVANSHHQSPTTVNPTIIYACYILRYLYETALDTFDK